MSQEYMEVADIEQRPYYFWSSLLSLIATTTMNFWTNHFLKTRLELKRKG